MSEATLGLTRNGSRRKGLVLVAVVFLLGLICGSALTVIGVRAVPGPSPFLHFGGGPPGMDHGMQRLFMHLHLDADQREAVHEIFDRSRGAIHEILEESHEEIRAILTEEQREIFDESRSHRRRKMPRRPI